MAARKRTRPTGKKPLSVTVPVELIDELRDCVVALGGPPHRLTIAGVVEAGLRRERARWRRKARGGKPFPKRRHSPRVGRPISS